MNADPPTQGPTRSWFRFGLRTMFIGVTILCCYLAWESSVVRQRQSVLKQLRADPNYQITTAEQWSRRSIVTVPTEPVATVSLVRRWLGDQAIQEIVYRQHLDPASPEVARIGRTFPEATFSKEQLLYEPCHPGCFPAGTLVETPSGLRRIETIRQGDCISAIAARGDTTIVPVQTIFVTDNQLWQVDTDAGSLVTTQTQPLCADSGENVQVGDLITGDTIVRWRDGVAQPARVVSVARTGRVAKVYNLILGNSEVFVAGGFLARSKPPAE